MSTTTFTVRELTFIAQATEERDGSTVGDMVEDYGYTAHECGGFISSLIKKGVCVEWHEPQAMSGYCAQFAFTDEVIAIAQAYA